MPANPKYGSAVADDLIEGMQSLLVDARAGKLNIRNVQLAVPIPEMGGEEVRRVRELLKLSQPLFAAFIGASASAVRAWEREAKTPTPMARRFLDLIRRDPSYWLLKLSSTTKPVTAGPAMAAQSPAKTAVPIVRSVPIRTVPVRTVPLKKASGEGSSAQAASKVAGSRSALAKKRKGTAS